MVVVVVVVVVGFLVVFVVVYRIHQVVNCARYFRLITLSLGTTNEELNWWLQRVDCRAA